MRLKPGMQLAHYQIVAPLGAGGMGEVYRARDARLERDVAIKVLPERLADSVEARARFEREAKVLAALSHPSLVVIFDVGTDRGMCFAVMELLAGDTLFDVLARGVLPLRRVLEIGIQIADGLAVAHGQGIVHRDLKPGNIFLCSGGTVKIFDFGLARLTNSAPQGATLDQVTSIGQIMGTVGYMSPEQSSGDNSDARGDIFSLGCVLYEMATGRRAFPGQNIAAVLAAVLRDQPTEQYWDVRLPAELKQIITRALAKSPEQRYQSASELAAALRALARIELSESSTLPVAVSGERSAAALDGDTDMPVRPCVAVLPLRNLSASKADTAYIVDGMTEVIIAELARNRALRVVSRTTAMQFRDSQSSLRSISRELGADAIVEGSVLLAGSSARITVQLVRSETDEHLWAESYQRQLTDVLELQSEVAEAIAQEIKKVFFDEMYRRQSRRVLATLIRVLGDFDIAEESLRESFAAALQQWPREGVPANPRAWLVSTGRAIGVETIRQRAQIDRSLQHVARRIEHLSDSAAAVEDQNIEDDRLRLIFTCCHPSLPRPTQLAMMLGEVCGLTVEEIARALLMTPSTVTQLIARGRAKIRDAGIPYQVPSSSDLQERLDIVLQVTYLLFNEGYAASSGASLTRNDLCDEAIRLGRLIVELLPDGEAMGLLALMLIQQSRSAARISATGDPILLEDQDRSLWNQEQIREGQALLERALALPPHGPYIIQAAIAATHAAAATPADTDWNQIVALYEALLRIMPSPVVALNRAIAVAMRDGPAVGLELIEDILANGELADYHLAHAARADLCRRLGKVADARESYERALALVTQEPERRFLEKRLRELAAK